MSSLLERPTAQQILMLDMCGDTATYLGHVFELNQVQSTLSLDQSSVVRNQAYMRVSDTPHHVRPFHSQDWPSPFVVARFASASNFYRGVIEGNTRVQKSYSKRLIQRLGVLRVVVPTNMNLIHNTVKIEMIENLAGKIGVALLVRSVVSAEG